MKRMVMATVLGLLLAIAATAAQAAVSDWQEEARKFSELFGANTSAVITNYFEDGSFVIEDEFGNVYKGCQLGMPCDDSATMTTHVYMPTVSK